MVMVMDGLIFIITYPIKQIWLEGFVVIFAIIVVKVMVMTF